MRNFCLISLVLLGITIGSLTSTNVYAQGISGVVNNTEINDTSVKAGDIVSATDEGIKRSATPYDEKMIGVISDTPVLSVGEKTATTVGILSAGRAFVNVSAAAGEIKTGDFITSSSKPGIAEKATKAGYVLGRALASYNDKSKDGEIPVLIDINLYTQNPTTGGILASFFGLMSIGLSNTQNFPLIFRYMGAAVVGGATLIIAAFSFLRFMRNGLEAIGRNPLAKKTIVAGILLNAGIVGVLMLVGLGISIAIVVF